MVWKVSKYSMYDTTYRNVRIKFMSHQPTGYANIFIKNIHSLCGMGSTHTLCLRPGRASAAAAAATTTTSAAATPRSENSRSSHRRRKRKKKTFQRRLWIFCGLKNLPAIVLIEVRLLDFVLSKSFFSLPQGPQLVLHRTVTGFNPV